MSGETRNRRRVRRTALLWVLGLGAALGSLAAAGATVPTLAHSIGTHRKVKLIEPAGARAHAPVGAQRRAGKTVTARAVRHSLPR
jgi:cobalamin biosynthesis protein CbiD